MFSYTQADAQNHPIVHFLHCSLEVEAHIELTGLMLGSHRPASISSLHNTVYSVFILEGRFQFLSKAQWKKSEGERNVYS